MLFQNKEPIVLRGNPTAIAWQPDEQGFAIGYDDGHAELWSYPDIKLQRTFSTHKKEISSICFSPKSNKIAISSLDGTVTTWITTDDSPVASMGFDTNVLEPEYLNEVESVHAQAPIYCVRWMGDSERILIADGGGSARVVKSNGNPGGSINTQRHGAATSCVHVPADPSGYLVGYQDGTVCFIENSRTRSGLLAKRSVSRRAITDIQWNSATNHAAVSALDGTISIISPHSLDLIASLKDPSGSISSIAFWPEENCILSASCAGEFRIWNWRQKAAVTIPQQNIVSSAPKCKVSPLSKTILLTSNSTQAYILKQFDQEVFSKHLSTQITANSSKNVKVNQWLRTQRSFRKRYNNEIKRQITLLEAPQRQQQERRTLKAAKAGWLHKEVAQVALPRIDNGDLDGAVFDALKLYEHRVQTKAQSQDIGRRLMSNAFGGNPPPLKINKYPGQTGASEQEGYKLIAMGTMQGIRNIHGHTPSQNIQLTLEEALECLAVVSFLMRKLDRA